MFIARGPTASNDKYVSYWTKISHVKVIIFLVATLNYREGSRVVLAFVGKRIKEFLQVKEDGT